MIAQVMQYRDKYGWLYPTEAAALEGEKKNELTEAICKAVRERSVGLYHKSELPALIARLLPEIVPTYVRLYGDSKCPL